MDASFPPPILKDVEATALFSENPQDPGKSTFFGYHLLVYVAVQIVSCYRIYGTHLTLLLFSFYL